MSIPARFLRPLADLFIERFEFRLFKRPRFVEIIDTKSLECFDVRKFAQMLAAFEAAEFYNRYLYNVEYYDSYLEHLRAMARKAASCEGLFLEFGVATGTSIKAIAAASDKPVVGFDSFGGLPEDWRYGVKEGAFAMGIPEVPKEIELQIGRIEDTLPRYLATLGNEAQISFIHIDTDLYTPAKLILSLCRPYMRNTVLVFDEFFNYPGWQDHEYKAFVEFQSGGTEAGIPPEFECTYLGLGGSNAVSARVVRKPSGGK